MGLGIGMSLSNSRAVISGLLHRGGTFHRTPKYRIESRGQSWWGKRYRADSDPTRGAEAVFALYFLACMIYAWKDKMWISLPFLYLFVQGYGYMAILSYLPSLREVWARARGRRAATVGAG